ncbi:ATP-binding protein [Burkholderiaceae bacterium DAT-1]|nr:ATP-binding protein [Burkholderiaceae bacterium DAT-1]
MRVIRPSHISPEHPIATQEYAVFTPPINELIETFGNWINRMESGGYTSGPSRFGKTRGVKWYVRSALEERFNASIPLVIWVRRPDMHVSEAEFWKDLLLASKFQFIDPMKITNKRAGLRELFRNRMVSLAKTANSNYIVLLIDEAQDVTLREWQWLLGLQNILDLDGYRLSVFSIGTHQIGYQHDYLAKTGNAHIAARFFLLYSRFHGLRSLDELRFVLEGYDQESEWPAGSGKSYLHYFAPGQFMAGHRLSACADVLWQALNDLLPLEFKRFYEKRSLEIEIPMKHVAQAVEEVLWRLAEGGEWEVVTNYDSWVDIIRATGFSGHIEAITRVT